MKKILICVFFTLTGIGFLASCSKEKIVDAATNVLSNSLSVTINGTSWTATGVTFKDTAKNLAIYAITPINGSVGMQIPDTASIGSHAIDGLTYNTVYFNNKGLAYPMTSGSVVVTSNTGGVVSGTFSGTGANPSNSSDIVTLTNGSFTVKYK